MPKKEALFLDASQVEKAIRTMYSKAGYVVLSQVRNGTGYARSARTSDMIALQTWPSRGLECIGIEIKVSKSDLRKELSMPEKAESIAQWCTSWFLACPDGLDDGELIPDGWGMIHVNDKLTASITKKAVPLSPKPMDALFVCSVLRNFQESYIHAGEISDRVESEVAAAKANLEQRNNYQLRDAQKLLADVKAWEDAHGLKLINHGMSFSWNAEEIGKTVSMLMKLRENPADALDKASAALAAASAAIKAIQ